jgi:hypothetical protein
MNKKIHFLLLTGLTLLVMVISAVNPLAARADDSTPAAPATQPPAADTSAPSADTSVAPASTSVAPADTSVAPADTSAPATAVAPTDTSAAATIVASTDTTVAPTDTTVAPADTTIAPTDTSTVVGAVPTGTSIVVLDATGTPVPLATQAAADIVKTGDPIWCPSTPGAGGCTPSAANLADLVAYLSLPGHQPSGSGTIWIEGNDTSTSDIVISGASLTTWAQHALTLQGGWSGSSAGTISGVSDFSHAISISGWLNDVTLNDITIENTDNVGLYVQTTGNITVHNVKSNHNSGDGAYLDNHLGSPTAVINISDSDFSNNREGTGGGSVDGFGLEASSNGSITLTDVTADNNLEDGALLSNYYLGSTGAITVDNSGISSGDGFNDNGDLNTSGDGYRNGLEVYSNGSVALTKVTADSNLYDGTLLGYNDNDTILAEIGGNITVTGGDFSDNNVDESNTDHPAGLEAYADGYISLSDVTADGNYVDGTYLNNTYGSGVITIDVDPITENSTGGSSTFSNNSDSAGVGRGLIAHSNSDIALSNVTASDNAGGGVELDNCADEGSGCTDSGNIILSGNNTFNDNGFALEPSVGLYALSNYNIGISGVTALGNGYGGGGGAYMSTNSGDLAITNSVFSENCTDCELGVGFAAFSRGGDISLEGVTADGNGNNPANGYTGFAIALGALISDDGGNVFVTNSDFSGNCTLGDCSGGGIEVIDSGTGTPVYFDHVTANGNGVDGDGGGAFIATGSNIDINCSTFNNNSGVGLEADTSSGSTITLNGVTLNGNSSGTTDIIGGTLVITNSTNCGHRRIVGGAGQLPWNVINVPDSSGQGNPLSCSQYVGTDLVLPNGDHALLPCPIGSVTGTSGSISRVTSNKLPGTALDSKFTFVSAFDVEVNPSLSGGMITVSFKIPAGKQGANFAILHWDGTKWVKVNGSINPPGYFSVTTSLTGDFVLVTQ